MWTIHSQNLGTYLGCYFKKTRVEIFEIQFVLNIDTLISNMFLGLKNMEFGDVPLTKTFHFNIIKFILMLFKNFEAISNYTIFYFRYLNYYNLYPELL
jgi:hypothetical protein